MWSEDDESEKKLQVKASLPHNTSNLSFQIGLKKWCWTSSTSFRKIFISKRRKKFKTSNHNIVLNLFCVLALDMHIMPFSFLILVDLRKYIENFQRSCTVGSTNPNFVNQNVVKMWQSACKIPTIKSWPCQVKAITKKIKKIWNSFFSYPALCSSVF